jgi:hypothetical protein
MTSKSHGIVAGAAFVLLSTVLAPVANADCGYSAIPQLTAAVLPAQSSPDLTHAMEADQREGRLDFASIVGLWHITVTANGQVFRQGIETFHRDGAEVLNDTGAPSGGNVCLGVWIQTGPRTYKLKHPFWTFDSAGNLTGSAVIREQITLDQHGQTFSGNATVDILDLSGNLIVEVTQQVSAQRITVDF